MKEWEKDHMAFRKQQILPRGVETAGREVQKASAHGVLCHTSDHALGHHTSFEAKKTPGQCTSSKQWSKPNRGICKILETGNVNQRKAEGILDTREPSSGWQSCCRPRSTPSTGTTAQRRKVSRKCVGTNWLANETDFKTNYSKKLLVNTKKIKAKK